MALAETQQNKVQVCKKPLDKKNRVSEETG